MSQTLKQKHIKQIWTKAQNHYESSKVGLPKDLEQYHICECCDQPIHKEPISLNEHTKQFQVFGFGYPLYFSYLKYCILLIVVLVASKTSTSLYMATKENHDFCYGKGRLFSVDSHGQGKPHHFGGGIKEKFDHLDLRHFGQNSLNLNFQHSKIENEHNKYDATIQHYGKTQTSEPSKTKQTSEKPSKGSQSTPHNASEQGGHSGGHSDEKPGDHSESKGNSEDHGQHHHVECTSFMVYFSLFVGEEEYNSYFLRIVSFCVHLFALIGIRNMLIKEQQYYDERTCSLSDYSIMVSNLPNVYGSGAMVRNFFREEFGKDSQLKELIYVFEDERIEQFQQQIQTLKQKQLKAVQQNNQNEVRKIKNEIHELQSEFRTQISTLKGDISRDYIKCDKIIVIMNTEADKGQVLQKFQECLQNKKDFDQYFNSISSKIGALKPKIKIKEAPEPNQIIWEHIDESDISRKKLIFWGWFLTLLFLAVVTVVFYFIMLAKTDLFVHAMELQRHNPHDITAKRNKTIATVIVFIALFGVILFNKFIMGKVLHYFVHLEKHAYTDVESHSFAMKYSLGMFFTTALMTLAVEAITLKNFYSHPYGVIEQETIMFFVTAFFIPLVWLIHPYNLAKNIQYNSKKNTLVSQEDANQLIEDFPYDLGKRYAEIYEIMWFTFLYSQLIPLGSFLILIGLVLYYWIDKYNFLRRSALKLGLSGKIMILSLKSLDATLFLAPAGRALFDWILQQKLDILNIILTAVGLIYLLMPISDLIWHFNEEKFLLEDKTYDQAKYSFKEHYFTLHPAYKLTHKNQIEDFRKKVVEHYRQEMKKTKMFGAGRGHYTSQNNREDNHGNAGNSTNASRVKS